MTTKLDAKKLQISLYRTLQNMFDILSHLGVAHQCDRRTDRRTEWLLATAPSNDAHYRYYSLYQIYSAFFIFVTMIAAFLKKLWLWNHISKVYLWQSALLADSAATKQTPSSSAYWLLIPTNRVWNSWCEIVAIWLYCIRYAQPPVPPPEL